MNEAAFVYGYGIMRPDWARGPALAGVAKPSTKAAAAIIEVMSAAQNPTRLKFLRVELAAAALKSLLTSRFLVDWESISFFIDFFHIRDLSMEVTDCGTEEPPQEDRLNVPPARAWKIATGGGKPGTLTFHLS